MVLIDVAVAARPDEVAGLEVALLRDHVREERVARDVEGNAQEHVAAALIELAGELPVSYVELEEAVAGRERHLVYLRRVPRAHHQSARVGRLADALEQVRDLVDRAAVCCGPRAPLTAIDGAELAVLVGPLVPNGHVVVVQILDVGRPREEPEELVDDRSQMELLRRDEREPLRKVEAHLAAEERARARARAVGLVCAVFKDLP